MTALLRLSPDNQRPSGPRPPAQQITATDRALLNQLRMAAMGCRAAARTDLFEACALLALDGEDAKRTFIDTFVKCLPDATRAPIKWFAPGTVEMSFDEAWVMRCVSRIVADDQDSLSFLLKSRIAPAERRYIGFLLGRISDQIANF